MVEEARGGEGVLLGGGERRGDWGGLCFVGEGEVMVTLPDKTSPMNYQYITLPTLFTYLTYLLTYLTYYIELPHKNSLDKKILLWDSHHPIN